MKMTTSSNMREFRSRNHEGKKCVELSEKAPDPGQLACGELSRVLWRDVQGIVAGCLCGELSGIFVFSLI